MTPMQEYYKKSAEVIIANLRKRNMEGYYAADKASALQLALSLMPEGSSVAWGGSMSIKEIGLLDEVMSSGKYDAIDRTAFTNHEEEKEIKSRIINADYFLMSTNAITLDGELVNIDGHGNRVSYLCYGPEHVIIIAGMNKVSVTLEEAINRVKFSAAPPNAMRLERNTPCRVDGVCHSCFSPECICTQTVITRKDFIAGRIKVILVGEALGY